MDDVPFRRIQGDCLPTHLVNLDALIKRADFAMTGNAQVSTNDAKELGISELSGAYGRLFRKGDFQRATSNWDSEKIVEFVKSFLDGEVIPSVILWSSLTSGNIFIIDGAHRLSALLSWIQDDYGDGFISKEFWGESISSKQKRYADATRKLMNATVSPYAELLKIGEDNSLTSDHKTLDRARSLIRKRIGIQWILGDAAAAERSFIKINAKPSILDPTEHGVLMARRKPNAIATRAIMQAGTGNKPWNKFPDAKIKQKIETIAKEIHGLLFEPALEPRITKPDLPIGGQPYSAAAFGMVFDLVNLANKITPAMWKETLTKQEKSSSLKLLDDDVDGSQTVKFLGQVRKSLWLITGSGPQACGSLGINPLVYCYSPKGVFHTASLLSTVRFAIELKAEKQFNQFRDKRKRFEEFLISHRYFAPQLGHSKGSRTKPLDAIVKMYRAVFDYMKNGTTEESKIVGKLCKVPGLESLGAIAKKRVTRTKRRDLIAKDKNSIFLKETIESPHRCSICGARLHSQSLSTDHKVPKSEGGTVDLKNLRSVHPYCNSSRPTQKKESTQGSSHETNIKVNK